MSLIAKQKEVSVKQKGFGKQKARFFFYPGHARPSTSMRVVRKFCCRERRQCG
jgi:hypothetical protein